MTFLVPEDVHGNVIAREGCDRCFCGCKYWENDRCVDCGTHVAKVLTTPEDWAGREFMAEHFQLIVVQ